MRYEKARQDKPPSSPGAPLHDPNHYHASVSALRQGATGEKWTRLRATFGCQAPRNTTAKTAPAMAHDTLNAAMLNQLASK
jgi:hypothetical protein